MTTFTVSKEEFHKEAKIFFDNLPTLNEEQAENGLKALGLLYLGVEDINDRELNECAMVYRIATRKVFEKLLSVV